MLLRSQSPADLPCLQRAPTCSTSRAQDTRRLTFELFLDSCDLLSAGWDLSLFLSRLCNSSVSSGIHSFRGCLLESRSDCRGLNELVRGGCGGGRVQESLSGVFYSSTSFRRRGNGCHLAGQGGWSKVKRLSETSPTVSLPLQLGSPGRDQSCCTCEAFAHYNAFAGSSLPLEERREAANVNSRSAWTRHLRTTTRWTYII